VKIEAPAELPGAAPAAEGASGLDALKPQESPTSAEDEQKKIDDLFKEKK
jgi:hypothetical protein